MSFGAYTRLTKIGKFAIRRWYCSLNHSIIQVQEFCTQGVRNTILDVCNQKQSILLSTTYQENWKATSIHRATCPKVHCFASEDCSPFHRHRILVCMDLPYTIRIHRDWSTTCPSFSILHHSYCSTKLLVPSVESIFP